MMNGSEYRTKNTCGNGAGNKARASWPGMRRAFVKRKDVMRLTKQTPRTKKEPWPQMPPEALRRSMPNARPIGMPVMRKPMIKVQCSFRRNVKRTPKNLVAARGLGGEMEFIGVGCIGEGMRACLKRRRKRVRSDRGRRLRSGGGQRPASWATRSAFVHEVRQCHRPAMRCWADIAQVIGFETVCDEGKHMLDPHARSGVPPVGAALLVRQTHMPAALHL